MFSLGYYQPSQTYFAAIIDSLWKQTVFYHISILILDCVLPHADSEDEHED